jgi:hypothetical protein
MASSSSAKKVARVAARSGGGSSANKQANWLFPAAIAVIIVLGIGIVVYARSENGGGTANDTPPRAQLVQGQPFDHWHAAFAIDVCGKEQPPPTDAETDVLGIHTHGDGLIHIHPFASRAAGKNATLKRFFDQVGLKVTDDGFETSDGKTYKEGETTCGGKPGEVVLAHWKDATTAASTEPDQIYRKDFPSVRLSEDLGAYTLAFEEKGATDIPAPSAAAQIEQLGAVDGGSTSSNAPETGGEAPADPGTEPATDSTAPASATSAPATEPATEDTTATTAAASE